MHGYTSAAYKPDPKIRLIKKHADVCACRCLCIPSNGWKVRFIPLTKTARPDWSAHIVPFFLHAVHVLAAWGHLNTAAVWATKKAHAINFSQWSSLYLNVQAYRHTHSRQWKGRAACCVHEATVNKADAAESQRWGHSEETWMCAISDAGCD